MKHTITSVAPDVRGGRSGARGALRFDRRFAQYGVPRLQLSSETKDPTEFAHLNALLTRIADAPNGGAVIREFAAGRVSLAQLRHGATPAGLAMLADMAAMSEKAHGASTRAAESAGDQVASHVASFAEPAAPPAHMPEPSDIIAHIRGPRASTLELIERPLWDTAINEAIPRMDVKGRTAERYAGGIRALRDRTRAFAMDEDTFQMLADLSEEQWNALDALRRRLLSVDEIQALVALRPRDRRAWLQSRNVRIGIEIADPLKSLDPVAWQAIERTSDFAIGPRVFEAMERLRPSQRAELRHAVRHFGPEMKIRDLVLLSKVDWKVIAASWGTSNADWNHMRRSLSAVLTTLFHDDTTHPVRREVISAMPLLPEVERIPDLPPALVWRILEQLPDHARNFPMVLLVTGLRVGEYERLEPHHLQHDSCRIEVPGTKTDASHDYVEVSPDVWPVVVRGVPSPYRYGWMRRVFREACEKAGVEGVTLHDLRHCHGQWAMENGAEEHEVQAQLRHRSIAMTRRYVKTMRRKRAAEAATGHFMAAKPE